ncbi:MAG: glycosyltransferase family 2 protein [Acidobacteria bacterium]|nr:glycosyltransferase family 2 protein [Acidobacteriota bacterium]
MPETRRWTIVTWSRTADEAEAAAAPWLGSGVVERLVQAGPAWAAPPLAHGPTRVRVESPRFLDTVALRRIADSLRGGRVALFTAEGVPAPREPLFRRLEQAFDTGRWGCLYSRYQLDRGGSVPETVVLPRFQEGSARDTFPMGPVLFFRTETFRKAVEAESASPEWRFAALQGVLLECARRGRVGHVPEALYTFSPRSAEDPEAAHFAYQRREDAERQREMEDVFTGHLRRTGAWLPPPPAFSSPAPAYPVDASVIIPVRNRVSTVAQAVESAATQEASFPFNVLVVDNHSDDGTSARVAEMAERFPNVVHLVPPDRGRGIGGCWQYAVEAPQCGRWAVQLDSDDLYAGPRSLSLMVDCLRDTPCALAVGAYRLVNHKLEEVPPGVIDHREWTPQNGHNNLLRVEGIGAPRAYDVRALRRVGFPDVSYGEDYAVALALSRQHRVGRVYDPVYLCRRWEGNTDSRPSSAQAAANHEYKDYLRTCELALRRSGSPRPAPGPVQP